MGERKPFGLIIEDDDAAAIIFSEALKAAGFDYEVIKSGDKSLWRLGLVAPDLVILDILLPHVSGIDILGYIRSEDRLAEIMVIVVTADRDIADEISEQGNADYVFVKPVSFVRLRDIASGITAMEQVSEPAGCIRVLIAEDQAIVREGLCAVIDRVDDIMVVGTACDNVEAQAATTKLCPDVLLLGLITLSDGPHPRDTVAWVREHCPETSVLIFTAHDDDAHLSEMAYAGAVGYIAKTDNLHVLFEMIRAAARKRTVYSGEQLMRMQRWRVNVGSRLEQLTQREKDVLRLLMRGMGNAAIADILSIEAVTVAYHLSNVMAKLGVSSRAEAMAWLRDNLPYDLRSYLLR